MPWMGLVAITGRIERRVFKGEGGGGRDEANCRCKENHPPPWHGRIFQGAHPSDYTTNLLTILVPLFRPGKCHFLPLTVATQVLRNRRNIVGNFNYYYSLSKLI